jgi:predicted RNase H-like HicB family nuclease
LDEDGFYVSDCVELGVASFGATVEEAMENLADAVVVYLNTLGDRGERRLSRVVR